MFTNKLICYYNDPLEQPGAHGPADPIEWELFDLVVDPHELNNVIDSPEHREIRTELFDQLVARQQEVGDTPFPGAMLA